MIFIFKHIQMAENLGAIARVMKNFGLEAMRLVAPLCDPHSEKAYASATGAGDILDKAHMYPDLEAALEDLHYVVGTCGDIRQGVRVYHTPESLFMESVSEVRSALWGIVFGCERTGLSQNDLSLCNATMRIPTNLEFPSMNISHAVAVIAYAYRCMHTFSNRVSEHAAPGTTMATSPAATHGQKHHFFQMLEHELDAVGYWRVPAKKEQMKENLANMLFRCDLTAQEIQTLFGLVKSLRNKT